MPRKTKTTSTEKKFTTVPPAAKPATKPVQAMTPVKVELPATAPIIAVKATPAAPAVANVHAPVAKVDNSAKVKPLVAALNDPDADVAREAATSLGLLGEASAIEPLIEVITNAQGYFHSVVRSAAAVSLGQLKDHRAVDALLNAVHDPIADSSSEAIRALAALGDGRAVSALIEVVRNRSGFFVHSVRRAAVLGLVRLGGEQAQSELRAVSADGWEDSVIREEATAAVTAE